MSTGKLLELLRELAPERNHDIECGLDGYDGDCLRCRADAALAESPAATTPVEKPNTLTVTRNGPCLEDPYGGKWWNEHLLQLTQSDKANVAKVERLILDSARAENDLAHARRESRKLRAALELAAVEVSMERTWCILCRTECRSRERNRAEHPHDRACTLYTRSL